MDFGRAVALGRALSPLGGAALSAIVSRDPQYVAVERIVRVCGARGVSIVVGNALVSYRLTARGEDYWLELAGYVEGRGGSAASVSPVVLLEGFLDRSAGNRLLRVQKKRRLERARSLLEDIAVRYDAYRDLGFLYSRLLSVLGGRGGEKTIVFAVKMAYYAYRALGLSVEGVEDIPLPVDRRIGLLSVSSGIVRARCLEEVVGRYRSSAIRAWSVVSRVSRIPLVDLDAVLWLPLRGADREILAGRLEEARRMYSRSLYRYAEPYLELRRAEEIARLLIAVKPEKCGV